MKVKVKSWHAISNGDGTRGNTGHDEGDDKGDVGSIYRVHYEGYCPKRKVPAGDDCPLVWGEYSHVLHMRCILNGLVRLLRSNYVLWTVVDGATATARPCRILIFPE